MSLEEAAENLGAGKFATLRRVVVPLMTGGLLAGFVTSFTTAAVELSATLLLVAATPTRRSPTAFTSTCSPPPGGAGRGARRDRSGGRRHRDLSVLSHRRT